MIDDRGVVLPVSFRQVLEISDRWDKACGGDVNTATEFNRFLKTKELNKLYSVKADCWMVSPVTKERIDMLLGPNWYAIIKAFLALEDEAAGG